MGGAKTVAAMTKRMCADGKRKESQTNSIMWEREEVCR